MASFRWYSKGRRKWMKECGKSHWVDNGLCVLFENVPSLKGVVRSTILLNGSIKCGKNGSKGDIRFDSKY